MREIDSYPLIPSRHGESLTRCCERGRATKCLFRQTESVEPGVNNVTDWEERIRAALAADPRTIYELAKLTGLQRIKLTKFRDGEKSLNLDSAAKLATVLGFELVKKKRPASKRSSP
jgi:ribosome-binding protein aMBF1 (putative translation factor)